jgi:predicted  nucleic acid-binding Zn-ribbon protein
VTLTKGAVMAIWGKAVLNIEKGSKKITVMAATFSDWVKTELQVIRLRIRIDETQTAIDQLHRQIGRKIMNLKKQNALPESIDLLLRDEEIVMAMAELTDREQEIEELKTELKIVRRDLKTTVKQTEDIIS